MKIFRKVYQYVCGLIGYAYDVCSFQYGGDQVTVRVDGWVTLSDGASSDTLPIGMCGQQLINRIEAELGKRNGK